MNDTHIYAKPHAPTPYIWHDGGRATAGFRGMTSDCVIRSIAIITERPYSAVYADFKALLGKGDSPRNGIATEVYKSYLLQLGWQWTPTMHIGKGCTVHLKATELPKGRLIVRLSQHLTAVINGVIFDTHDPARGGTRCVYGYFSRPNETNVL